MPLTQEEDAHLTEVLSDLEAVIDDLYATAQNFVRDQIDRHSKYGARMFLSPKQIKWLHDLQGEFCQKKPANPLRPAARRGAPPGDRSEKGDDPAPRDDMDDDEIPF